MWDEKSIYPKKIETGYACTKDMNDKLVEKSNAGNLNQGSAILKIHYYNLKNSIFQHLPVKQKVNKPELDRMRNDYTIDTLTGVDIQLIVKIGGKVIEIFKGFIYRENFIVSPCRNVTDKLFALRQKYNDANNAIIGKIVYE